jgi:2-polyprenyl-3-methyl-5-hydroxy-6-metoxy-1,4-benzoquinol methylase
MRCNLCGTAVSPGQPPRWHKEGFDIFQCQSCSLLFRGELPEPEELPTIYDGDYFCRKAKSGADGYADYLREETEHRLIAKRRARWLDRLRFPGRLLDVGAAAGFFMDEARNAGWQVEGIDVSQEMSRRGREQLGLEITTGPFQHAAYSPASFDAVTMWDYIEHSIDPASDISKAAEVLRPGGMLMLSTGDATSAMARISGRRWHLLTPRHHNFFFTCETLKHYLEARDFELTYVGYPGAYYSLRYLFYKLQTMAPRNRVVRALGDWTAESSVGERALYVNLHDILTIHARRI